MPGRKFSDGNSYRFGFNGKEDDRDWGAQNVQDYGFRLYNPSIGKFLSVDPLSPDYPWYTPYQFAGNMPIWAVDLDGLEQLIVTRYFENNQFVVKIELTIETFTDTNKSGERAVWGVLKNRNNRVEYTNIDREGNRSAPTYSPNLNQGEEAALQEELNKNRRQNGTLRAGAYVAYERFNLAPPPPPPPPPPAPPTPLEEKPKPNDGFSNKKKNDATKPGGDTNKSDVIVTPKEVIQEPKSIVRELNLDLGFESSSAKFTNKSDVEATLTPILKLLLQNSENKIVLQPNTGYPKYKWVSGLIFQYYSEDLVKDRGEAIKKWFTDNKVNPAQIKILVTSENFNKSPNVTGKIEYTEEVEDTN